MKLLKILYFVATALSFVIAASVVFASLGETPDLLQARYGFVVDEPSADEPDTTPVRYYRDHVFVTAYLRDGRSVREDFAPDGGRLTSVQIAGLLRENSAGSSWKLIGDSSEEETYIREDGLAAATVAKRGEELNRLRADLIIRYTVEGLLAP
jgi:hypothetical protein